MTWTGDAYLMISGEYSIHIAYSKDGAHCRIFHGRQQIGECLGYERAMKMAEDHNTQRKAA